MGRPPNLIEGALWERLLDQTQQLCGIDLRGYRRGTLQRRLSARMAQVEIADGDQYLRRLRSDPAELRQLVETLTIHVSEFFRDPLVFELLAERVLPPMVREKRQLGRRELRVWSAGCATGEEAYSVAILLRDLVADDKQSWRIQVFGTDIDQSSLLAARHARYGAEVLGNVKLRYIRKYFAASADSHALDPRIRALATFSRDDLTSTSTIAPSESVFGGFDLILCRNVLIYFSSQLQQAVCSKLRRALSQGGYLVLGRAETLHRAEVDAFAAWDAENRIFQRWS